MSEYFPKAKSLGGNMKVELNLSNYATKADLKNVIGADISKIVKKIYLAITDQLDIGKLDNAPVDLKKIWKAVKKDVYGELFKKS